jgi:uncharacterized protein (TIGR02099 family)
MRTSLRHPLRNLLRVLEMLAWAAFFAFAIVFLALRYWLLPNVEHYRDDIVASISRSVGLPVKIGALSTDWQGLRPRLSIADVRVYDRDGREALVLPAVENVVAWRSLFARELRLHSFVIDGPKLTVRRDAGGELYVAGIRISGDKGDGRLADWILSQSQIVVRNAEVEWQDESRKAPPLKLSALNFRLENDGDEHSAGLSARPPRELGPGLEVRARLAGASVRQLANWSGRVYAELGSTNLAGWRAWVDYPLDVRRGDGALRLWATLASGRISEATADVALSNVSARLARDLPVLEIANVRGRVYGRETAKGYDFGVRRLALARPGAPEMSATSFRASWEPASGTTLTQRGSVHAELIELGPLSHLAEFLPFPADLRALLAELRPQGRLQDAKIDWKGELPDRAVFIAKARFAELTMNAWHRIPGFANMSGSVEANERKGTIQLAARKSELDLPRVFPEPRIALEALNGEVSWERNASASVGEAGVAEKTADQATEKPAGFAVRFANLSFANDDFAGTAHGNYAWRGEGPGTIDLSAQLSRADGKSTARYLPLSTIMGARAREWVAQGVLEGQASDARLRLKGDLREFPFLDPAKGQFQVTTKVSGAVLDYARGWPRIEAIEGNLTFDRDKIEVVGRSGTILGVKLANVKVTLPSMIDPDPHLIVEGGAEGPTAIFLDYIRESPVRRMIGGFTDPMTSVGRGKLHLRLDLALHEMARSKVTGDYQFAANSITVDSRLPPIERASGRVSFTEHTLTVTDVRGQLFGDQVRISGGSKPEAGVLVTAEGRATVEGIRPLFDHAWRRRLAGAARYTAAVTVKDGRAQISFDSTLEGVSSALPAPLAKNAADALPLRVDVFPGDGRDRIAVALGPPGARIIAADFLRVAQAGASAGQGSTGAVQGGTGAAQTGTLQVQRSLVTLNPIAGETLRIPERRGMTVRGSLPALDLDRWLPLFAEGSGGEGASYDLQVGVLDALGKRMRAVSMQGVADSSGWSANMNTAEFAGDLVYRTEGSGRLVARLARFSLPEDAPSVKPGEGAKDLPAVDIVADSFVHRGRKLGRIEVQARHEGRDWRIEKLAMTNPDAALSGSGLWKQGDASRTTLAF